MRRTVFQVIGGVGGNMLLNPRHKQDAHDQPWLAELQRYLAAGQRTKALELLNDVIENDMPLFGADPMIRETRREAWIYRIALLRECGRFSEALAWTCLECELHPENVTAQALKE